MPVKVGNSYVSEAAYEFAKAEKFPKLKFSIGTTPFSGSGLNNVAIAPLLRKVRRPSKVIPPLICRRKFFLL